MSLLASFLFTLAAFAQPLLVLDPGHEPSRPGAIGVCGKPEVQYNDELAAAVTKAVAAASVTLTRAAGAEVSVSTDGGAFLPEAERAAWKKDGRLYERAGLANRAGASLFLSIHHDSTKAVYQEKDPAACGGQGGKRLGKSFWDEGRRAGFSIFIYKGADPARYEASLKFARAIGAGFLAMGRHPSTQHGDPADCASCRLVDAELGVWEKNLAVLRSTTMPAVLVEAGLIVDTDDEAAVNQDAFRAAAAKVIADAVAASLPAEPQK